ncbi:TerD family protein [Streptomyces pharetrae]|uniref:TerD family protein n=1 Tax=Streptomyces pharetrae TaxID=291370 RepID=UPI0036514D81
MTHIIKGATTPVPAGPLRVAVGRGAVPGTSAVDASALLLDATGRVRGDADLVFRGRLRHPSGAVRHAGVGQGGGQFAEWLELDLPDIEPAVQRVVITGSCAGGTFGQVPGLYARVVAYDGTIAAHYEVTDASAETAFVLGEFYRRDGAWRFRAVGQGYDSGLAGLATDFGCGVAAPAASGEPIVTTGVSKTAVPPPGAQPAVPAGPPAPPGAPAVPPPSPSLADARPLPPDATGRPGFPGPLEPAGSSGSSGSSGWSGSSWSPPYVRSGTGAATLTVDPPFPPGAGPVIVEARVRGTDRLTVRLTGRADEVFDGVLPGRRGRALVQPPRKGGPLRLDVRHDGDWTISVLPLSAARPFGTGTVRGQGPDVLAYPGTAADLRIRVAGRHQGRFRLSCHRGDTPDDLRRPEPLHSGSGRIATTVRISDGPLLLVVDTCHTDWELTALPLSAGAPSADRKSGVHEGRGQKTVTLVNPQPGRPALVRYEFRGAEPAYGLEVRTVGRQGGESGWLSGYAHGTRGVSLAFASGAAESTVRVRHSGEWTLRLLPEEEAPLLTGPVEGKGSTVLRYQGPPALMRLRRASPAAGGRLAAWAWNHPSGEPAIIADVGDRPALGPLWVHPGGSAFVAVAASEYTRWRLAPASFDEVPVLGGRAEGTGYGVVRHIGPGTTVSYGSNCGDPRLCQLDENLFPWREVTATSGPYVVSEGILHVRALGDWTLEAHR